MWDSEWVQRQQVAIQELPLCTAAYKDNCSRHPIPHSSHLFTRSSLRDIPFVLAVSAAAYRSAAENQYPLRISTEKHTYLTLPHRTCFQTLSLCALLYRQMTLN